MFSYVEKNLNTCTYTLSFSKIRIDYILHVFLLKVCFMLDPKCHCMCFTFLWAKRFKVASWEYFFFFFPFLTAFISLETWLGSPCSVCPHIHLKGLYNSAVNLKRKKIYSYSHPNFFPVPSLSSPPNHWIGSP